MDRDKRIAELEAIIEQRDARIRELKKDVDSSWEAVSSAHELMHEWHQFLDEMKESYARDDEFWARNERHHEDADAAIALYNKFVREYNKKVAAKLPNLGRPLAATPPVRADVLKRRKAGQSLRSIAEDTGLGLQTVRTIIDKADGVDRATLARLKRIAPDKFAAARERVNRSGRKGFPRRIDEAIKEAKASIKELKGLGAQR